MPIERRRVLYEGRVQGVGFRYTTVRLAQGFAVEGFVRNLPDGGVEVVAEGEPEELSRFADAIGREMSGHIRSTQVSALTPGNPPFEIAGFSVQF
jgi:acylphosphatase